MILNIPSCLKLLKANAWFGKWTCNVQNYAKLQDLQGSPTASISMMKIIKLQTCCAWMCMICLYLCNFVYICVYLPHYLPLLTYIGIYWHVDAFVWLVLVILGFLICLMISGDIWRCGNILESLEIEWIGWIMLKLNTFLALSVSFSFVFLMFWIFGFSSMIWQADGYHPTCNGSTLTVPNSKEIEKPYEPFCQTTTISHSSWQLVLDEHEWM